MNQIGLFSKGGSPILALGLIYMWMIIGGIVGWYASAMYCTPVSNGGTITNPCGEIKRVGNTFLTTQTMVGLIAGAIVGSMIVKK